MEDFTYVVKISDETNKQGGEMKPETMMIDEQLYVRADSVSQPAEKFDGMDYVIVRSYAAGCFAGYLVKKDGREVTLKKARRLWYWNGASSLSQLAMEGVKKPNDCKFPCELEEIIIDDVCEVIKTTEQARKSVQSVSIWKQ